jgi:Ice-binding-like/Bacterial Ig-like domain
MLRRVSVTVIALALAMTVLVPAITAFGFWRSSGIGVGAGTTGTLQAPTNVIVPPASGGTVTVSWTASGGTPTPTGYYVMRTDGSTFSPACGSAPTTPVVGTSCIDTVTSDGSYSYLVVALFHSWTATSSASGTVKVSTASQLAFTTNPTNSVAGIAIAPAVQVTVESADGRAVATSGISITLAIGNNPGNGTLAGTITVITDATGIATFDDLSINTAGVGYTLAATSDALSSAVSAAFDVLPSGPARPALGRAASYSVLGTAATNGGVTTISGDVGAYPTVTVTGFPDGTVQGVTHAGDATASGAETDLTAAYADALGRTPDTEFADDLIGVTFTPGVHHTGAALELSANGVLTLDGKGNPNAVFIFQINGALNTAASSSVHLINGAQASNVFWQVNGAAGTGALSSFSGTILAAGAITLGEGSTLIGRALSSGAVTLASNTIRFTAALPPTIAIDGGSTGTGTAFAPSFSGTTSAPFGQLVTVAISGQTLSTAVGPAGTWAVTGVSLAAGAYSVLVRVRDAAGNAATASQIVTLS